MRKTYTLLTLVLLVAAATASAQDGSTTLIGRVDTYRGGSPVYSAAMLRPEIEVWVFTLPDSPDIEVGRLWKVAETRGHSVMLGGYAAYVTKPKEWYFIPWAFLSGKALGGAYALHLAGYVPLNGGTLTAFTDDSNLMWEVSSRMKVGVSGTFWKSEGEDLSIGAGPKLSYTLTEKLALSTRYAIRHGGANQLRFQLDVTF